MLFWLRWAYRYRLGTKNTVLVVDGCRVLVEDGAVGWSCKCSSGRHCRRIGGHRSRDRARPSCSLSRGHNLRLASPGARIQAARGLEFCVLGIVVHLRLGNCIGYSLREHECLYLRHVWYACFPLAASRTYEWLYIATSWAHIPRRLYLDDYRVCVMVPVFSCYP